MSTKKRSTRSIPLLRRWTMGRATGTGIAAGLASLLLWVLYDRWPETVLIACAAALALTAFCGLSMLWITATDIVERGSRNERIRVVRTFDVVLALLFAGPALLTLDSLFG